MQWSAAAKTQASAQLLAPPVDRITADAVIGAGGSMHNCFSSHDLLRTRASANLGLGVVRYLISSDSKLAHAFVKSGTASSPEPCPKPLRISSRKFHDVSSSNWTQ
jgi:hypothetical protein